MYLHTHEMPGSRSDEIGVLPAPELDNLLHYAKVLYDTKHQDHIDLMVPILRINDHVGKLLSIFEQCAQQNDLSNMRTLRGIFSTLLLWADTYMIQLLVVDKHIHGVVSVLDVKSKKPPSLSELFENIPRLHLIDVLKRKILVENIRQSENLEFFKNQIATLYQHKTPLVNALDRMRRQKHSAIVTWMQQDIQFVPQLFRMLRNNIDDNMVDQKRSGLRVLSIVFEYASNDMELFASAFFFRILAEKGLLDVIQQLLCVDDNDIQTAASHLLYTTAQMNLWVLQNHILSQNENQQQHHQPGLLHVVLDLLANVNDYGLKQQLFDTVKLVLNLTDTPTGSNKQSTSSSYRSTSIFNDDPITGKLLKLFYEHYSSTLFLSIRAIDTTQQQRQQLDYTIEDALVPLELNSQQILFYSSLCEFLQSILSQYGTRTKRILQDKDSPCFQNMVQLLRCPDPSLRSHTIGFFRAAMALRDNDINRLLIQQNVFAYLGRLLLNTYTQHQHHHHNNDKRIYKELVDLYDFIHIRNIYILMEHIVSEFGEVLEPIPVYQLIKKQYDKQSLS